MSRGDRQQTAAELTREKGHGTLALPMAKAAHPYASSDLVILGVIHRDTGGGELLARCLDAWEPDVITLEFSSYGLEYRSGKGQTLKRKAERVADGMKSEGKYVNEMALDAVLAYLDPPCEFSIASAYVAARGLSLCLVDNDRFSRERLMHSEELVSESNLEKLLSGPVLDTCEREKAVARLYFDKGLRVFPYTEEMMTRDARIADRIAALMKDGGGKRFLHVCGWQHLCDPLDLYASLRATKVFIHDKALCL